MGLKAFSPAAARRGAIVLASAGGLAACSGTAASTDPIARTEPVRQTTSAIGANAAAQKAVTGPATTAHVSRSSKPTTSLPLAGKVVGIDPGHNGLNYTDPTFIDHPIWNGREDETCNTTGTQTDGGYTEAQYN
jgi:N-acetylmuramoyl-L-alanine amidase